MMRFALLAGAASALVAAPAPRCRVSLGAEGGQRLPPGPMEAALDADYETWISGQLRVNRIQGCTSTLKDDVVAKLRAADAAGNLDQIGRDINALVNTNNGVTEKARSSLLTATQWEELLPVRGLLTRYARFAEDGAGALTLEYSFRVLGPLLTVGVVVDAVPGDDNTIALKPRFWTGSSLRVLGARLPLPRLLALRPGGARSLALLYVDVDVLVLVDRSPDGADDALRVYGEPSLRVGSSPLRLRAKVAAWRARRRADRERSSRLAGVKKPASPGTILGGGSWRDDDAGILDVDEGRMQTFLDASEKLKTQFSVQDMLDGRPSKEDVLTDLAGPRRRDRRNADS